MKSDPISVYAFNATVMYDGETLTGKAKYFIRINTNAGDGVDRIQRCHDYDQRHPTLFKQDQEERVFEKNGEYIAFAMHPRDSTSNFLITCRCSQPDLSREQALEKIKQGMQQAYNKAYNL